MSVNLSIGQMLAQLEARVAHHAAQKAIHDEQERLHGDKAAFHREQLEAAQAHLEAFRAASAAAGELLQRDRSVVAPTSGVGPWTVASSRFARGGRTARGCSGRRADRPYCSWQIDVS